MHEYTEIMNKPYKLIIAPKMAKIIFAKNHLPTLTYGVWCTKLRVVEMWRGDSKLRERNMTPRNHLRLVHIIAVFFMSTTISCTTTDDNDDYLLDGLQKGRTRRMLWLDKKRNLILPPSTSLSVTPILAFPLFKQSSTWVAFENLEISWTFFSTGLGWTSNDNAWPLDFSNLIPNMTSPAGISPFRRRLETCNSKDRKQRPDCGRAVPIIMSLPPYTPGGERATLIGRAEEFLNSFKINGRACLQRVVCEVFHHIPLKYGFGLFGEFLTMLFSVSESDYAKSHLPGYLKAEIAGKYGDCSYFMRKCPYSIFTSK